VDGIDVSDGNIFAQEINSLFKGKKQHYSEEEMSDVYGDKAIVAFVDILGFRSMIEADPKGERFIPIIEKAIVQALTFARISIDIGDNPAELEYRVFSDNICFWMPVRYHTLSVVFLLSVVAEFQLAMVFNGVFCRGGIAIGYHHASEHILYGPALVESIELEHCNRNPSITISDSIAEDIHLVGLSLQMHLYHKIAKGEPWFVNYLYKAFYIDKNESLKIIKQHHDIVLGKLKEHRDEPRILSKYEWIAAYHNDIVSMFTFKDECPVIRVKST
jgi:hypothetical protein